MPIQKEAVSEELVNNAVAQEFEQLEGGVVPGASVIEPLDGELEHDPKLWAEENLEAYTDLDGDEVSKEEAQLQDLLESAFRRNDDLVKSEQSQPTTQEVGEEPDTTHSPETDPQGPATRQAKTEERTAELEAEEPNALGRPAGHDQEDHRTPNHTGPSHTQPVETQHETTRYVARASESEATVIVHDKETVTDARSNTLKGVETAEGQKPEISNGSAELKLRQKEATDQRHETDQAARVIEESESAEKNVQGAVALNSSKSLGQHPQVDSGVYIGKIIAVDGDSVRQETKTFGVVDHAAQSFTENVPRPGQNVVISYANNQARATEVREHLQRRELGIGR